MRPVAGESGPLGAGGLTGKGGGAWAGVRSAFSRHELRRPKGKSNAGGLVGPPASDTPLVRRRPGYSSPGCTPAEPDSASPGRRSIAREVAQVKLQGHWVKRRFRRVEDWSGRPEPKPGDLALPWVRRVVPEPGFDGSPVGENRFRCFGPRRADTDRRWSPASLSASRRPASEAASLKRAEGVSPEELQGDQVGNEVDIEVKFNAFHGDRARCAQRWKPRKKLIWT